MMRPKTDPAHERCAAGTLRRATRSVARLYDAELARAGLTTTQFSLLRTLHRHRRPVPLSRLADEQVFERTSLYRAIAPLRREGLVAIAPGRGRANEVRLTAQGRRRIAEALPYWKAAQRAFVGRFGSSAWATLADQLDQIVTVARTGHGARGS
jgi:DNA-binding MarR family transcriptional regulator